MKPRLLILGAGGFLGRYFQDRVTQSGEAENWEILGVDRKAAPAAKVPFLQVNVTTQLLLNKLLTDFKPHYVLSFLGTPNDVSNWEEAQLLNYQIGLWILESAANKLFNPQKILLLGSAAEYGIPAELPITDTTVARPVTVYGFTKYLQTETARFFFERFAVPVSVARPFNVIGKGMPNHLSIGRFVHEISIRQPNETITVGNLAVKRDFVAAEDVGTACWDILTVCPPGKVYNVCTGQSLCLRDILDRLIKTSRKPLKYVVSKQLLRDQEIADIFGDSSPLYRDSKWRPRCNVLAVLDDMMLSALAS